MGAYKQYLQEQGEEHSELEYSWHLYEEWYEKEGRAEAFSQGHTVGQRNVRALKRLQKQSKESPGARGRTKLYTAK